MKKLFSSLAILASILAMTAVIGFASTTTGQSSQSMAVSTNSGGTPPVTMVLGSVDTKFMAQAADKVLITDITKMPGLIVVTTVNADLHTKALAAAPDVTYTALTVAGIPETIAGACKIAHDASMLTGSRAEIIPSNASGGYVALTDAGSEGNYHNGKMVAIHNVIAGSMTSATT